jgi:hypothetical protein
MNSEFFVEKINTKEDFIRFLDWFYNDLNKNGQKWENRNIGEFLLAMQAFLKDSTEKSLVVVDFTPSWKMFAIVLMAGRVYE